MPKGLQTLGFLFDEPHLTHFGGLVLMQRFCQQLQLRRRLQRSVPLPHRPGDYLPADLLLALLFAVIAGLRRLNKTDILQYNGAFLSLLGLAQFPDQSTLRRGLRRLSPRAIRQVVRLHDQLRRQLFGRPAPPSSLIFDVDSVVLTLYGEQQGARVGYNPKKKGRRSYHPLLCFEAGRQEFWHGSLRPGNTATNAGVIHFLRRCLAKVPPTLARGRIRVRADAGYFSGKLITWLENQGLGYVIVAREYRGIQQHAQAAAFQPLRHGGEVAEFSYTPTGWKTPHRFVVLRRPRPTDPAEARQLTLFQDRHWAYTVLVTNLGLTPWRVWRFYCPRATIEKNIRELLYDLPLGKIPSHAWVANVAFFQLVLLAYDLARWFKRLCLPPRYLHATLETLRTDLLVVPARLVRCGGRNVLHLPRDYHHRDLFVGAFAKAGRLRLPRKT
jgi:Transposase DDE domain group 1